MGALCVTAGWRLCSFAAMGSMVTVVVPVFREAPNIEPLTRRLFDALDGQFEAELIFVDDDSQDGSEKVVERLAGEYPVRILVRRSERGLASAVLHGFAHAKGDVFVVMDGDLQHPPALVPELVRIVANREAEIAVGSRYVSGGRIAGRWSTYRWLNSIAATLLARPLVSLRDPMSGFCALRREIWERADRLSPVGYKIVLELIVKSRCRDVVEVPMQFEQRQAGESKLTWRERWLYLLHLLRLYRFRYGYVLVAGVIIALTASCWLAASRG